MMRARDRIAATEAVQPIPPDRHGEMRWARRDGTVGSYIGPLTELGQGIPRPRSTRPIVYRLQRALWHLALGYVSGFPVRDILAFTRRGFWSIPLPADAPDAIVEPSTWAEVAGSFALFSSLPAMTEDDYVALCEDLAQVARAAPVDHPPDPHWLVPLEPEEE